MTMPRKTVRRLGVIGMHLAVILLFLPAIYFCLREGRARAIARQTERRLAREGTPPNTTAWPIDEGQGFNPDNRYWVVVYDCRDADVEIKGVVPKAKYWSLVPYNEYMLPLASYVFDGNVVKDEDGAYTAYLTTRSKGRPNEIDVSASPVGGLVIRTSFPEDAAAANRTPRVRPIARD
jgi:hypothetical protein